MCGGIRTCCSCSSLRALPDRYPERVEVRGELASIDLTRLPDEQLARIPHCTLALLPVANACPVAGVDASAVGPPPNDECRVHQMPEIICLDAYLTRPQ